MVYSLHRILVDNKEIGGLTNLLLSQALERLRLKPKEGFCRRLKLFFFVLPFLLLP